MALLKQLFNKVLEEKILQLCWRNRVTSFLSTVITACTSVYEWCKAKIAPLFIKSYKTRARKTTLTG